MIQSKIARKGRAVIKFVCLLQNNSSVLDEDQETLVPVSKELLEAWTEH